MKRLVLIVASAMLTYSAIAQSSALFQFRNGQEPRDVHQLGTAPEFPMLMNKSSASEVYNTIKRSGDENMDALLRQMGYANGAQDLEASDVSEARLQTGAIGNMGSAGHTYDLYRLQVDGSNLKAWKIAANGGNNNGAMYFLARCGNSFYPRKEVRTACVNVPVEVKPDMSQISLPASGSKVTTDNKTFVYYTRKRNKKDDKAYPVAGLNVQYPSDPLPVKEWKNMDIRPETYTVSLSNNSTNVTACANKTLSLTGNVNVEKTSTYTGNYPADDHATYVEVSKRHYKMIARKMRNAERKANKIAKRTGTDVVVTRA